jgi:hypothetical protein
MSTSRGISFLAILTVAATASGGDAPRLPSLAALTDRGATALALEDLDIEVTIQGHLARTEYLMTYRNDLDRELRADFLFPLPAGAHLSDVGLYFGDQLRRASVVGRSLARTAYENVVPRFVSTGRDPIVAEWATGNSFRYDVYPIPRRGEKRIYVAYDEELSGEAYELDLRYGRRFRRFRIRVKSENALHYEGNLPLDCRRECEYDADDSTVDALVRIQVEQGDDGIAWMELGTDGLYYLSLPLEPSDGTEPYPATGHLTLLWDASGTTASQSLSVLEGFLRRFVEAQARPVDVTVVPFHAWKDPSIDVARVDTDSGRDALRSVLQSIAPVGGTYLPALLAEVQNVPRESRIVLVTDGLSSMGPQGDLARSLSSLSALDRGVLVINSSPSFDVDWLQGIARATGGWYVDLRGADEPAIARQVERAMSFPRFLTEASWEESLDRGTSQPLTLGGPGRLSLTARLATPAARGEVRLRFDGPRGSSYESVRFLTRRTSQDLGLLRGQWARDRLKDLLVSGDGTSIKEHGIRHHLLTPETSLVVLETWRDYLTHGVPMPPDVRHDYAAFLERENEIRREWEEEWRRLVRREGDSRHGPWTLEGRIEDTWGGVLPGVRVTVSSRERGTEHTALTDDEGRFRVLAPATPGPFRLRAELQGFQSIWYEFNEDLPGGTELERIVMGLAGVCESVIVSLGGPPPSRLPVEKTELPEGARISSAGASSSEGTESWRFARWLGDLGLEGMRLPENWVATRRGLSKRVSGFLSRRTGSDREILEMYVAARSVLGPSPWLAVETARKLFHSRPEVAARIAGELLEHDPEEAGLARVAAQLYEVWDQRELAEPLLLRALEQAPHQLQSYLHWIRFGYRGEPNDFWDWVDERRSELPPPELRREVDWALRTRVGPAGGELPVFPGTGLQVELVWDRRSVDLDLEVIEPSGRRVHHRDRSSSGAAGRLSSNEPSYGPEAYIARSPASGRYTVRVRYVRTGDMELETATLGVVTVYLRTAEGKFERSAHPFVLGGRDETWEIEVRSN